MAAFAIVQERFEQIDSDLLREALRQHAGFANADAARVARKSRGILTERLNQEQAESICQELRASDYAVRVLPTAQIPARKKPKVVNWLGFEQDAFHYPFGYSDKTRRLPWTSVFVVSAGRVAKSNEAPGRNAVGHVTEGESMTVTETSRSSLAAYVLDITAASETEDSLHLRFPAMGANYQRTLGGALANTGWFQLFQAVLQHVVTASSYAIVSPETRRLLVEQASNDPPLVDRSASWDENAFADYNRWLLMLAMFRAAEEMGD